MSLFSFLRFRHRPVIRCYVFALVGKSGTGKSYHAQEVARARNIPYIIDDGLLLGDNKILAGISAKSRQNYVKAIKTALFQSPVHRRLVISALREHKVKRLLILGTSKPMVDRIARTLYLSPVKKTIYIEDISPEVDRNKALKHRMEEGAHVIPVPLSELKKSRGQAVLSYASHFFYTTEKLLFLRKTKHRYENSLVHPIFNVANSSPLELVTPQTLRQIVHDSVLEYDPYLDLVGVRVRQKGGLGLSLHLSLEVPEDKVGEAIYLDGLRDYIISKVQSTTSSLVWRVTIRDISKRTESRKSPEALS